MNFEQESNEGVRVVMVDKGAKPNWKYKDANSISDEMVNNIIATEIEMELEFRSLLHKK